ncbi:MAG: hypothetical protein LVQ64_03675 [Thermoplasmatales archaeon]|nr:hypothetical protein [Thermoplasmatales archaeon]
MTAGATLPLRRARLRRPGRLGTALIAVAIALVVIVASLALYYSYAGGCAGTGESGNPGEPTITIYTYSSLLGGPCCTSGTPAAGVFSNFSSEYHARVQVDCLSGNLVSTLYEQRNNPAADLVIGLDEITAPQAEALGLLQPYSDPADLAHINSSLVAAISTDGEVIPYEYGYLAIDYTNAFYNATRGAVANSTFADFAANSSWARQLVYEDPTTTAFDEFGAPYSMVVSYTTDPAYATYYGQGGTFNSTVTNDNGTLYGWKTIYGIGIVKGSGHVALDNEFIHYFLSGSVQGQLPLTEWEYPANETVPLPPVYAQADLIPPSSIHALNSALTTNSRPT